MYQSLSMASFAPPPILKQGFHILAARVFLAHLLSELKASDCPPHTSYGRCNSIYAINIACISATAFCSVDIT